MRILLAISIVSLFGVANAYAEIASPYEQLKSGVSLYEIQCEYQKTLLESPRNNKPVCVKSDTADILVERGWHMIKIFDELPTAELQVDELPIATTSNQTEGSSYAVSDPVQTETYYPHHKDRYIIESSSGGGIDLSVIEPLPEGVYLPTTIENYERIMQKILDGIDDKLILPNSEGPRYDYTLQPLPGGREGGKRMNYTYYTEQGNIIRPDGATKIELIILEPDEIFRSDYLDKKWDEFDSLDQKDELAFAKNLIAGPEEFIQNFVEKSGLPRIVNMNHDFDRSWIILENGKIEMRMEWDNVYMYFLYKEEPHFTPLSRDMMRQLMHQFAIDNAHVIEREWCDLTLYDSKDDKKRYHDCFHQPKCDNIVLYDSKDDIRKVSLGYYLTGIPIWEADVGTCDMIYDYSSNSNYPANYTYPAKTLYLNMEGITGEIGWFESMMTDDWIDKINIPEHAKIR